MSANGIFFPLCQEWPSLGFTDRGSCISVQVSWISKTDSGNGLIWFSLAETCHKTLRRAPPMSSLAGGGCLGDVLGCTAGTEGKLDRTASSVDGDTQSNHYRFQCQIFKNATDKTLLSPQALITLLSILVQAGIAFFWCVYLDTHTYVHTSGCTGNKILISKPQYM